MFTSVCMHLIFMCCKWFILTYPIQMCSTRSIISSTCEKRKKNNIFSNVFLDNLKKKEFFYYKNFVFSNTNFSTFFFPVRMIIMINLKMSVTDPNKQWYSGCSRPLTRIVLLFHFKTRCFYNPVFDRLSDVTRRLVQNLVPAPLIDYCLRLWHVLWWYWNQGET